MIDFNNKKYIIGIDEVGRGALAGPLVVGAVRADEALANLDLKDSKMLSKSMRKKLSQYIMTNYKYSIIVLQAPIIDHINILNATKMAMNIAIAELCSEEDYNVYVDGNFKPFESNNIFSIIKGDQLVKAISAASIIAKVFRDEIMTNLANYNNYNWESNFGYGTKKHILAIQKYGIGQYHRKTFIKKYN